MLLPLRWNWQQYCEMNPDIASECSSEDISRLHWLSKGYSEGRLYHPEQLVVTAEFGFELLIYVNYFYWLHQRGLLFDHVITTYPGMRVFYWFLPSSRIKEVPRQRTGHPRPGLFVHNPREHVRNFDLSYYHPAPLQNTTRLEQQSYDYQLANHY